MLLTRLNKGASATHQSIVLPTHLTVRESTGPAPA
jgi:DNA-binding LacI/PurR family transcriptional regulator